MNTNVKPVLALLSTNRQIVSKCSVLYACRRTFAAAPAGPCPKPRLLSRRILCGIRTVNQVHDQFSLPRLATSVTGRQLSCFPASQTMYRTEERGVPNTDSYRVFIRNELGPISPFHDIPLYADGEEKIVNMVVEVPRWTNAKMEICKEEALNPIKQDIKKSKLRFVANCFPHHGYIWNYGALPQTWENPHVLDSHTGCKGDNDPIDVCEIGHRVAKRGDVVQVKVLGTLALIDEGETDWKVIAIDVKDPLATLLNDIEDVEKYMPGFLAATLEWFKIYKMPDGKPPNNFAFSGEAKNREFALKVIEETHACWKSLMANQVDAAGIERCCVAVDDCAFKVGVSEAEEHLKKHGECIGECEAPSSEVDKWHYVKLHQ